MQQGARAATRSAAPRPAGRTQGAVARARQGAAGACSSCLFECKIAAVNLVSCLELICSSRRRRSMSGCRGQTRAAAAGGLAPIIQPAFICGGPHAQTAPVGQERSGALGTNSRCPSGQSCARSGVSEPLLPKAQSGHPPARRAGVDARARWHCRAAGQRGAHPPPPLTLSPDPARIEPESIWYVHVCHRLTSTHKHSSNSTSPHTRIQ